MVNAYVGGIAPRSETYMRLHWDHAKGFVDGDALSGARDEEEARWQDAQAEAGLAWRSPAYVAWEDVFRPLASDEGGPLTRTFQTNTFHRAPILDDHDRDVGRWLDAFPLPEADWVLTLPSPYDAAVRAAGCPEGADEVLARHLNEVARAALARGAVRIRWQEPSALYPGHDVDVDRLAALLRLVGQGVASRSILHLWLGDAATRPDVLAANPFQGVAIEPPGGPVDIGQATELSIAALQGDSSLVEDPQRLRREAESAAGRAGAELWGITNAWDLEHVPHAIGVRKLTALAEAAATIEVPT